MYQSPSFFLRRIANWLICLGDRLEVDINATRVNQTAVLVSPLYNRSRDGHSKCLKFRYMLRGPGEKTLTIYQKVDNHRETAVWVSKRKTGTNWIFGQVPLSSISKFQVTIILRPTISISVDSSSPSSQFRANLRAPTFSSKNGKFPG